MSGPTVRDLPGLTVKFPRAALLAGPPPLMPRTRAWLRKAWNAMLEWIP